MRWRLGVTWWTDSALEDATGRWTVHLPEGALWSIRETRMKVFLWMLLFLGLWGFFQDFWAAVIAGVFLFLLLAPKTRSK